MIYRTRSGTETELLGRRLGKTLKKGLICLHGDLGAGKTTFVKGLAKGLGIVSQVQSPTFTYSRVHKGKMNLYHFDFYRLEKRDRELEEEVKEALEHENSVVAIEWPESMKQVLPKNHIDVFFEHKGLENRCIRITAL